MLGFDKAWPRRRQIDRRRCLTLLAAGRSGTRYSAAAQAQVACTNMSVFWKRWPAIDRLRDVWRGCLLCGRGLDTARPACVISVGYRANCGRRHPLCPTLSHADACPWQW